jgi:Putative prokaryotic signal transducing protein
MPSEDLARVCTVKNPTEAELVRSALKAVGIACEIGGEGQAGFAGVFEIDILARADDIDAARKYLRQLRHEKLERKRKRIAARKARASGTSEAIQELPPRKKRRKADD